MDIIVGNKITGEIEKININDFNGDIHLHRNMIDIISKEDIDSLKPYDLEAPIDERTKADLMKILDENKIAYNERETKAELLEKVNKI